MAGKALIPAETKTQTPATLFALEDATRKYETMAKSENTKRAYRTAWGHFTAWCAEQGLEPLPAHPRSVAYYLTASAGTGAKVSTMRIRLTAIGMAHRLSGHPFDAKHPRGFPGTRSTSRLSLMSWLSATATAPAWMISPSCAAARSFASVAPWSGRASRSGRAGTLPVRAGRTSSCAAETQGQSVAEGTLRKSRPYRLTLVVTYPPLAVAGKWGNSASAVQAGTAKAERRDSPKAISRRASALKYSESTSPARSHLNIWQHRCCVMISALQWGK
jgi:hypothetical protein